MARRIYNTGLEVCLGAEKTGCVHYDRQVLGFLLWLIVFDPHRSFTCAFSPFLRTPSPCTSKFNAKHNPK